MAWRHPGQSWGPWDLGAFTPHAWSCRLNVFRIKPSFIPLILSWDSISCLDPVYQRSAEHHDAVPASIEEIPRERSGRKRRQPISGLVSLQHLGGSERWVRSRAQAAGRKTARSVRDAQLWFCEEDCDARWLHGIWYHTCYCSYHF